jgi:hypothetical protein
MQGKAKKTVGLTTCYVDNFGACLQAYSLQKMIEMLGYHCEIIKYTPVKASQEKKLSQEILHNGKEILRIIKRPSHLQEFIRCRRFRRFRKELLAFGKEYFPTIESLYQNPPHYDIYVTGSDQLWNPIIHNRTNNKAYFLDFAPIGKKRVAYAPSIGLSVIPDVCKAEMSQLLNKMDHISIREEAGRQIVEALTDKPCRVVLDPTLLHDKDFWNRIAVDYHHKKPYIFCYLFGTPEYIGRFVQYVKEKTGYDVVVIPFTERERCSDYIKITALGPREFLGLVKNAALVITDSFHATAFSINLNVPFYSLLRNTDADANNMNSRIFNMLDLAGLNERLVASSEDFPDYVMETPDFDSANKRIREKRVQDIEYLRNAMED